MKINFSALGQSILWINSENFNKFTCIQVSLIRSLSVYKIFLIISIFISYLIKVIAVTRFYGCPSLCVCSFISTTAASYSIQRFTGRSLCNVLYSVTWTMSTLSRRRRCLTMASSNIHVDTMSRDVFIVGDVVGMSRSSMSSTLITLTLPIVI